MEDERRKRRKIEASGDARGIANGGGGGALRTGTECPYMGTINRMNLDFDFEKVKFVMPIFMITLVEMLLFFG